MKRLAAISLVIATASACASAEVVVVMDEDIPPDIEVQLLPYDRDAVFDSLAAAYAEMERPEPQMSDELRAARAEVTAAQQAWQSAENEWAGIRDRLQAINTEIERYSRGERRYQELFNEYSDLEGQLGGVERRKNRAFDLFTELQEGSIQAADSVKLQQQIWADEAYADIGEVIQLKLDATGGDRLYDTTDASGIARGNFTVRPGIYWVHARHELATTELYWNVRVEVEGGDPTQVRLGRDNAEEREIF